MGHARFKVLRRRAELSSDGTCHCSDRQLSPDRFPSHTADRAPPEAVPAVHLGCHFQAQAARRPEQRRTQRQNTSPSTPGEITALSPSAPQSANFAVARPALPGPHCRCASRDQLAALGGIEPPKSQDCKPWSSDLVTIAPATAGAHRSRRPRVAASSSTPSRRARARPWRDPRARARHRPEVMPTRQPPPRAALPRPVA